MTPDQLALWILCLLPAMALAFLVVVADVIPVDVRPARYDPSMPNVTWR